MPLFGQVMQKSSLSEEEGIVGKIFEVTDSFSLRNWLVIIIPIPDTQLVMKGEIVSL